MANMLLNDSKSTKQKGTIIDWLQKIDPELKELKIGLRQKVLFNKNPHLLTVFSHLSNWSHLKETIYGILKKETMKEYEAKAVLDFLSTCVFLKMQWQCNDKHKPKHDSGPQDVLKLSMHQVEVILEFMSSTGIDTFNTGSNWDFLGRSVAPPPDHPATSPRTPPPKRRALNTK